MSRTLQNVGGRPVEFGVRTRTSRRSVELDRVTLDELIRWRRHLERDGLPCGPDDWMFRNTTAGSSTPKSISQLFDRIVQRSQLPRIRFHDYPDVRVMPMCSCCAWSAVMFNSPLFPVTPRCLRGAGTYLVHGTNGAEPEEASAIHPLHEFASFTASGSRRHRVRVRECRLTLRWSSCPGCEASGHPPPQYRFRKREHAQSSRSLALGCC